MLQKLKFFERFDLDNVWPTSHQAVLRLLKSREDSADLQVVADSGENSSDTIYLEMAASEPKA